jgi:hypothetical protein
MFIEVGFVKGLCGRRGFFAAGIGRRELRVRADATNPVSAIIETGRPETWF